MKSVKNFFKLFLETFAWIMVLAVISLFIIRVIEKFVALDDTWQICIICAVSAGMDGIPKFHNLFFGKDTTIISSNTDITTDDSK